MLSIKKLGSNPRAQRIIGTWIARYLKLVDKTTRYTIDPPDVFDRVETQLPVIIAMWHGEHFMMPFVNRRNYPIKALISRHRDGEINAVAAEVLGVGTIRGSGDHYGRFAAKGGVSAFRAMMDTLEQGTSVALTADVPKVARRAGLGIVKLASVTGRTIVPAAIATSNRIGMDTWDKTQVNLPFGRGAIVADSFIMVPPDADAETLEQYRLKTEAGLNAATARAYQIVDRRNG